MDQKKNLKRLYRLFAKMQSTSSAEVLYQIIQFKTLDPKHSNYKNSIYLDVKKFIKMYIKDIVNKDFGYDTLNTEKLTSSIKSVDSFKERYELSLYAYRKIIARGYEEEANKLQKFSYKCKTDMLNAHKSINSKLRLVSHLCSYNLQIIILILLGLFILSYIIFLPSRYETFYLFELSYREYSNNFYLNHFSNLLSAAFGLDDNSFISPINWKGVVALSFLKFLYFVITINYLYQKAIKLIYAN